MKSSPNPTLFDIKGDILSELDSEEPDQEQIDALLPQLNQKIENYSGYYKNKQAEKEILEAKIKVYQKAISDLQVSIHAIDSKCDWLASEAKRAMEQVEDRRIEMPLHKVLLVANPPKVDITAPQRLDPMWMKTKKTISIDKKGILKSWKETGETPEGTAIIESDRVVFK